MKDDENEELLNQIKKLKALFRETQDVAYDLLAKAALTLPKTDAKRLFEQQTSEHLSILMDKIGLEKENYEICQLIKEVLDTREPDYDKKHAEPVPSEITKEIINDNIRISQVIPVGGVMWSIIQVGGNENYISIMEDGDSEEHGEVMKFGSWDEAFEYYRDNMDMQLALISASLDFVSALTF